VADQRPAWAALQGGGHPCVLVAVVELPMLIYSKVVRPLVLLEASFRLLPSRRKRLLVRHHPSTARCTGVGAWMRPCPIASRLFRLGLLLVLVLSVFRLEILVVAEHRHCASAPPRRRAPWPRSGLGALIIHAERTSHAGCNLISVWCNRKTRRLQLQNYCRRKQLRCICSAHAPYSCGKLPFSCK
jgi:hypothetical protein